MEETTRMRPGPCCLDNDPVLKLWPAQRKDPFRSGVNHFENSSLRSDCNGDRQGERTHNKGLGSLQRSFSTLGVPIPASTVVDGVNKLGIHQSVLLPLACFPPLLCFLEENVRGDTFLINCSFFIF